MDFWAHNQGLLIPVGLHTI